MKLIESEGKSLSDLPEKTSSWYGIRKVVLPFESFDVAIAIGYWGVAV